MQDRIRSRATGAITQGTPPQGGHPWWNLFISNKILVWKIFATQKLQYTRIQLYIIFLCCVKYQRPQQQLISLQVLLSASLVIGTEKPISIFGFVQCKYIWFSW